MSLFGIQWRISLWLLVWLLLAPAAQAQKGDDFDEAPPRRGRNDDIVEFGGTIAVKAEDSVRQIVMIGGKVTVDGTVTGNLVVVGGSVTLNGTIQGELVATLSDVTMGPKARVKRGAVMVGGPFVVDPGAKIQQKNFQLSLEHVLPEMNGLKDWLSQGLLLGRPLPPKVRLAQKAALLSLVLCGFLTALFPKAVQSGAGILQERPAGSFLAGILTFVLVAPVCLLLVVSVVGILVVPFLLCGLMLTLLIGKAAFYQFLGKRLAAQIGVTFLATPIPSLLLGSGFFFLLYMVPLLGFLAMGIGTLFAMGASILAVAGSFGREGAAEPEPIPVSTGDRGRSGQVALGTGAPEEPGLIYMPRAGFWRRTAAAILDLLLFAPLLPLIHVGALALMVVYFTLMWTWKGTTIGGIVLGLKLTRLDGRPVTLIVALVRSLASFLSAMALGLGFFWVGWDREKQAWHDKIAGTIVVKAPKGVSLI